MRHLVENIGVKLQYNYLEYHVGESLSLRLGLCFLNLFLNGRVICDGDIGLPEVFAVRMPPDLFAGRQRRRRRYREASFSRGMMSPVGLIRQGVGPGPRLSTASAIGG